MSEDPSFEQHNPFEAPETAYEDVDAPLSEAERIRKEHLSHEASVKSVGSLYLLGGLLSLLIFVGILFGGMSGPGGVDPVAIVVVVFSTMMSVGMLITAWGLQKLHFWARVVSTVISVIGLAGFPIGTLINGYILYLLWSPKGTMVFSEQYKEIIAQTPHIKYKTSLIVWTFLILLLIVIGMGVVALLFAP